MYKITILLVLFLCFSCKDKNSETNSEVKKIDISLEEKTIYTIVFASCNDQEMKQPLWKSIIETNPDVFIWGGDNIYADTDDMEKMENDYYKIIANSEYTKLESNTTIMGTWDDHDYGKNDAGSEWEKKDDAQRLFLNFINVTTDDIRRNRPGVYHSQTFSTAKGSVKVILLDTRYFRSPLKKSDVKGRRYEPWAENEGGTILGETQWEWLEKELQDDSSNFTLLVSSIQFLADEHGWEKWGNFPSEVDKMKNMIRQAKANNIIILSGDRHLAEFSKAEIEGLDYPLIDFTTSGMTKTYPDSPDEPNRYRIGNQIKQLNFGVLKFDFENIKILMEVRGENNKLFKEYTQEF